jgi:Flp pilus assembly protein TadD
MALAQLGRFEEAIPDLRAAVAGHDAEAAVAGAFAFALAETGRREEASAVLHQALARYPGDPGLLAILAALEGSSRRK